MLPELQECITKTQDNLYRGYIPTDHSGLQWLDSVCADLHRLLRIVHKYLMFEQNGNVGTLETCFLCISQIVTCIRWLEKTITMELQAGKRQGLPQSRQCFLDRIIWCLERLKAVLESDVPCETVTESNFVSYLDLALSLISPLTVASDEGCTEDEYDRQYKAVIVESGRIRSIIEALITQTFGFCNVLPEEDRKRITSFCQKVLKECLALEREGSEQDSNSKKLRVSILESAIYQLETHVNECLLRVVYETFGDTDWRLLEQLRENITSTTSEDELDGITQPFDEFVERLMQIGLFAISYADNLKLCSAIRSSLASIEALDSYLIPSLYMGTHNNTILLEQHWLEESDILCKHVHKIIDTNAFALALIEQLDGKLDEFETDFNPTEGLEMARKVEIFLQHLEVNAHDVKLHEEPLKLYYTDYRTMTLECRAIVKCALQDNSIDPRRVIKRFRVLLGKLRKIQLTISNKKGGKVSSTEEAASRKPSTIEQGSTPAEHEVEESVQELYVASQMQMSSANILYRSRRGEPIRRRLEASSLLEINTFTDILDHRRKRAETSPEKGSIRRKPIRRNSLRVAMFKKQQRVQTAEMYDSMQSDIDLQITEILDELTDLSNTFSAQTPRISNPKVTNPTDTNVRKSITNEEIAVVDGNKIRINIFTDI